MRPLSSTSRHADKDRPLARLRPFCAGLLAPSALGLFGGLLAAAHLGCGNKAGTSPDPETPAAAAPESGGADVSGTATPAPAAPAEPRALPAFCEGAAVAPPPSGSARAERIKDGFVFVEGPVWSAELGAFFFSEMDF